LRYLTLPNGGVWPASQPGLFIPGERAPDSHWIGSWEGPRAGLEAVICQNGISYSKNCTRHEL